MEKPKSKVIQIATDSDPESSVLLHALCEDGSIWKLKIERKHDRQGDMINERVWEKLH